MKATISSLLIVLLIFSCKDKPANDTEDTTIDISQINTNPNPLEGAWELVGYYNYVDNEVIDSFRTSEGYRQVKMYTDSKVMWSKYIPTDSSEWFGYGSYTVNGSELVEILEYGSEMMSKIIQEKKEFKHELIINGDSFSQIEIDEDGNRIYAENYKRIE
ncbi:hypothetical protein [Psychroserpens luteolus]|uniref:hypothetical protein n=1 Tax=Psychroserpens luteolus TaxID=2855840 RepID=UPI001E4140FA|nr:hypothetical protein [Psychroserpens luteolus]MCD2260942.1 hypothetical protein [Psychroserpens luteolus]